MSKDIATELKDDTVNLANGGMLAAKTGEDDSAAAEGLSGDGTTTMVAATIVANTTEITSAEGAGGASSDDTGVVESEVSGEGEGAIEGLAVVASVVVDAVEVTSVGGASSDDTVAVGIGGGDDTTTMLAAGAMVAFSPVVINEIEDAPILGEGEATNSTNDLTLAVSAADGSGEQIQRSLTLEGEVTPGVSAIAADLGEEDLTAEVLAKVLSARLALQRSVSLVVNDTAPNSPVVLDTEVSDAPRIDVATVPGGESNMPLVVVASQADVSHSGSEDEGASDEEGDALAPLTSDGAAVCVDTAAELDLTGDTTGADADATA